MEFLLLGVVPLGVAIGAVLGWIAYNRTRELEQRINDLQQQVWRLKEALLYQGKPAPLTRADDKLQELVPPNIGDQQPAAFRAAPAVSSRPALPASGAPDFSPGRQWLSKLQAHWMIWLGGACIGLAGIFMVSYGIEQGLLGPGARIALALLSGLALHVAAEYLYRRLGAQPAVAALAGGASITLYAGLLAGLHLYQLLSPALVFTALALISFTTLLLALRHGPVLAAIGLLGAYVVPVLVSTGSDNMTGALIYALIVTAAALVLLRYVYRPWLWFGTLVGVLFWGLVSLGADSADGFRPIYLALLAWGLLALPHFDWKLQREEQLERLDAQLFLSPQWRRDLLSQLALLLVLGLSLLKQMQAGSALSGDAVLLHLPLIAVLFLAARWRDDLALLPWLAQGVLVSAILLPVFSTHRDAQLHPDAAFVATLFAFAVAAALFSMGSHWLLRQGRHASLWAALAFLAPVIWLALGHLHFPDTLQDGLWAGVALLLGGGYVFVATQRLQDDAADLSARWLLLAGHGAYSVAVAIAFQEAGLTLALALQLISLAWLMTRYQFSDVSWLLKLLVAVVVARLTFNPWLLSYPENVHWSLWTYGGATVCCVIAARLLAQQPDLRRWLEAAALHLLVLTLGAETRYWLYDGHIFIESFTYLEAAINTNLWAALGLVYYYRGKQSRHLATVYAFAAKVLLCLSLGAYALLLTVHNPFFGHQDVAVTPVFNSLLLAYGLPVLLAALVVRYYEPAFRRLAGAVVALAAFVFVNLEIRHLWNGGVGKALPTSSGELYTYSLVWLLVALVLLVYAKKQHLTTIYKTGMCLLLAVVAKIFVVDLSDLAGLLRVASFMGLGLALLGLAYLHRQLAPAEAKPEAAS